MTRRTEPDAASLRALERHLIALEESARAVTDTVLDHLQYLDAGPAAAPVHAVAAGLVDAFVTLTESLDDTVHAVTTLGRPPSMDGAHLDAPLDLTALEGYERAAR